MCTHIPSLLDLPLTPPQSQPSRSPQNTELGFLSIQQVPTGYLFYTRQCTYINPNLPIHPPPSVPRCPFSTSPWFFWSFLQLLPLSLSWVGCLSPFHLFLLELYLASSLQHVSVTSFCLTCFFYFVFSTDSLVTCPDFDKVAFCRSCPVPPSSTLPSCHQT